MSRVSKFAGRDPGPAARMAGFMAHLRAHGLRVGVAETDIALRALTHVQAGDPDETRRALKTVCTGGAEDVERFDDLFDSYWLNGGRVRQKVMPAQVTPNLETVRSSRQAHSEQVASGAGQTTTPDDGTGEAEADGDGKLVASSLQNLMKKDLRDLVQPEEIAEAEAIARRLGAALRHRRSRRRKAARKGDQIHFRKLIRQSLATGGEPLSLPKKHRPDRPLKIVALCDVSGSMTLYAQVFLAFLAGLMRADDACDAYLFHTRLVRIADALRDRDALRALGRMSVLADGFGGGSKIGASLQQFSRSYARRFVDGRSVVLILSDGYDTDAPELLGTALAKLKKRGCKIIWLNPLKGWAGYQPIAQGMAAALPHLDLFRAANRLADLAALEPELTRL
ncbi:vWA domain-containing protein [Parasedimentitalea psychrophila]|uniref:VWA domain-containing protein n=1 Tax=Parasedimentitalea psychrophila TaxID=2997337 RepID=A0A9Y2L1H5_9RHOB|nr:VWA domain-containing protein [Parasedimentitalea psychrophila]WIY26578.1 VWA domain-containing protein [Parasedimentitalea psychrophila]